MFYTLVVFISSEGNALPLFTIATETLSVELTEIPREPVTLLFVRIRHASVKTSTTIFVIFLAILEMYIER